MAWPRGAFACGDARRITFHTITRRGRLFPGAKRRKHASFCGQRAKGSGYTRDNRAARSHGRLPVRNSSARGKGCSGYPGFQGLLLSENPPIFLARFRSVTVQGQARQRWMKLCKKAARELASEIALLRGEKPPLAPSHHRKVIQKVTRRSNPTKRPTGN